jgi:predicted nucleotidyltransferase
MNEISKQRIELAKRNFEKFLDPNVIAAAVTGSVAKGYADDYSDLDTIILRYNPYSQDEFDKIIEDAKSTGGDLYHGTPEEGFACYYYFEGVKCDFGFGDFRETEKLIDDMIVKPEVDLVKHLQISGLIDGYILYGNEWFDKILTKAKIYPYDLQLMMVKHHLKFYPEWVMQTMGVERRDKLFFYETLIEITGNIIGILCGLNKMYHPGKLKGVEWTIEQMKIKPDNFFNRYNHVFDVEKSTVVTEIYSLVRETLNLIDSNLPEVSTERARALLEMKLRK